MQPPRRNLADRGLALGWFHTIEGLNQDEDSLGRRFCSICIRAGLRRGRIRILIHCELDNKSASGLNRRKSPHEGPVKVFDTAC